MCLAGEASALAQSRPSVDLIGPWTAMRTSTSPQSRAQWLLDRSAPAKTAVRNKHTPCVQQGRTHALLAFQTCCTGGSRRGSEALRQALRQQERTHVLYVCSLRLQCGPRRSSCRCQRSWTTTSRRSCPSLSGRPASLRCAALPSAVLAMRCMCADCLTLSGVFQALQLCMHVSTPGCGRAASCCAGP